MCYKVTPFNIKMFRFKSTYSSVNRVGTDEKIIFGGNTILYDPLGESVEGSSNNDEEQVVVIEVDLIKIKETRDALKCLEDRFLKYDI